MDRTEQRDRLLRALEPFRHERIRFRGGRAILPLLRRLQEEDAQIDDETAALLAESLEAIHLELHDREREAQQNLRTTSRTISMAIRGGLRG